MIWNRTRTLVVVLFLSVALNLFFAGVMAGRWNWHWLDDHFGNRKPGATSWTPHLFSDMATPAIEALWQKHKEESRPLRDAMREARHAIHQALVAQPFDSATYASALREERQNASALRSRHHAFMVDLAGAMTDEQREKLAKHAGRWRWRRDHR